jgi:hypothetical protein
LNQKVGLWDSVEDNALLSAKLGAAGSFIGDSIELGGKAVNQSFRQFFAQQAWNRMTLEQKLFSISNAITTYVKPSNTFSTAGTSASNAIANSAPTLNILNPQNTNNNVKNP